MSEAFFLRSISGTAQTNELFLKRASRTLTANLVMGNVGEPTVQIINAAATGRNVNLPLESINDGKTLILYNASTGAATLTLQSNAGAALVPAVTVAQNASVMMYCDGVAWRAISTA